MFALRTAWSGEALLVYCAGKVAPVTNGEPSSGENSEVPITENGRKSGEQIVRTGQVEFSLIFAATVQPDQRFSDHSLP